MLAKLDKLGTREKAGIVVALFAILAVAGDHFAAKPMVRQIVDLEATIREETEEGAIDRAVLRSRDEVLQEYAKVARVAGAATSSAETIYTFKGEIDDIARRTGVVLVSMEAREPEANKPYQEYFIEVGEFDADMKKLFDFLYAIRRAPGVLRVARMTVGSDRTGAKVKGSMLISKILLPPADGAGDTAEHVVHDASPVEPSGT